MLRHIATRPQDNGEWRMTKKRYKKHGSSEPSTFSECLNVSEKTDALIQASVGDWSRCSGILIHPDPAQTSGRPHVFEVEAERDERVTSFCEAPSPIKLVIPAECRYHWRCSSSSYPTLHPLGSNIHLHLLLMGVKGRWRRGLTLCLDRVTSVGSASVTASVSFCISFMVPLKHWSEAPCGSISKAKPSFIIQKLTNPALTNEG